MNQIKVLIVEDDPKIADLHRRFTENAQGYEVVGIAQGLTDAEAMVETLEPELILLDLYFPEGTTIDLLRNIRSKGLETDVILITAAREVGPLKEALRCGAYDYIIKPVMTNRFHECLEKYRNHRLFLTSARTIEQQDVDGLFTQQHCPNGPLLEEVPCLPKGIDPLTLSKVRTIFEALPQQTGLSAEEAATRIGASRSTARRYLEYLVSVSFVIPDVVYGTVGRPERRYFKTVPVGV